MRQAGRAVFWIVTLAWAAQIYYFSTATYGGVFTTWLLSQALHVLHVTVSPPTFDLLHELMRKSAHVTVYAILGMLPKTRSGKIMRRLLKARELGLPEGDVSTLEQDE